jgi:hypothetical protein
MSRHHQSVLGVRRFTVGQMTLARRYGNHAVAVVDEPGPRYRPDRLVGLHVPELAASVCVRFAQLLASGWPITICYRADVVDPTSQWAVLFKAAQTGQAQVVTVAQTSLGGAIVTAVHAAVLRDNGSDWSAFIKTASPPLAPVVRLADRVPTVTLAVAPLDRT